MSSPETSALAAARPVSGRHMGFLLLEAGEGHAGAVTTLIQRKRDDDTPPPAAPAGWPTRRMGPGAVNPTG